MKNFSSRHSIHVFALVVACFFFTASTQAQSAQPTVAQSVPADHVKARGSMRDTARDAARDEWFYRGRLVRGKSAAELRRRAYQAKLQLRAQHASALVAARTNGAPASVGTWIPLGPVPLASDASGNGTQDYRQVSGRATAIAIDPADRTGNTVYIGGAQSGVWKSINAENGTANNVAWTPLTDGQATLSIGAIAIQPGNTDITKSVILAATGEANNSADSYFGLGVLRSNDAGESWTLVPTANSGALSFSGLGGAEMAFSTASGQTNTVVAAMATTVEGAANGATSSATTSGLYTSIDAGQTWTYDALVDPGGATDATSATSVIYNATGAKFFAAIRYHGFYSSADGITWTRLATQPGGGSLGTSACPPQSTSNAQACPMFRGEIAVVPGRSEMYAWFVSVASDGSILDGGIWQSYTGGGSWNPISDTGITNCGDFDGCGVEQGTYNLGLLAVPNSSSTDLYAGGVNLYKCNINALNPNCGTAPFLNLTHAYGCDPIAAPAHVHPAQHAMAFIVPTLGNDYGNALEYFANDGGIYRALNGFGLSSGSCLGTNQFDDLNQNLGSMTQFVSFSQHPTDPNTLLGGAQNNGSPATAQATTNLGWENVLGGDGGYNAIDPNTPSDFYGSNPDLPPGGLGVQLCSIGVNCVESAFSFVVTSNDVGGDDGAFYFPYILDPQSATGLLVGTCRLWRGPRSGGAYTALSSNFDTLSSDTCSGSEINQVSALAAGGATDANGSEVIYAGTSGLGPINGPLTSPTGGHVWVTTNATAGPSSFVDVTGNGPQGSINPNQFPISAITLDPRDSTGATAYVTLMGFTGTGNGGHVWKTINAGVTWTDFTANLPDSPVNAVVVDASNANVYVGTDVGVFTSSISTASWSEVGPSPSSTPGFLPNAAVTALGIFNSGGEELLRASTYGRGIWQFPIVATPDFQLAMTNTPLTVFSGQDGAFAGTASALNGYASPVTLTCVAGATAPPNTCAPTPAIVTPGSNVPFVVTVDGVGGDYNFDIQGAGSDSSSTTHSIPVTLHVVSFALTTPSPASENVPRGTTSQPVSFKVTASGSFDQSVTVTCNAAITGAVCTLTPAATVNPTADNPIAMSASVSVPAGTPVGSYPVTIGATTTGSSATLTTLFTLNVTSNSDFSLSEPSAFPEVNVGSPGTSGPITITAQDGFVAAVNLSCAETFGANSCIVSPPTVSSYPATASLTINGTNFAVGTYAVVITGTSGSDTHTLSVPFNVGDYKVSGTQALTVPPGGQGTANLTLTSTNFYAGDITATCNVGTLSGMCLLSPGNPIPLVNGVPENVSAAINVPSNAPTGSYNIVVNTQDMSGEPSHSFTIVLTVAQDFTLTPASPNPSQTVTAGQTTGPYNLNIQPVGGSFNAAVTLACSNLPSLSQCLFNPSTAITPGSSAANVVVTIATTAATTARLQRVSPLQPGRSHSIFYAAWLLLPGVVIGCAAGRRKRNARKFAFIALFFLLMLVLSCGGVSNGGGGGGKPGTPPGTYTITVTGSSNGAAADAGQSTQVTLVVN